MIEYVAHYQFSFFAPGTFVEPSADIIGRLIDPFKDLGFFPTTIQTLQIGPTPRPQTRLELQLMTKNLMWNLAFEPHRVLLQKRNNPELKIGTPEEFIADAEKIFVRLLPVIPLTGTRLSYTIKGLLPEMSDEVLTQANSRFLNLPLFYSQHPPCEWITRNVTRYEVNLGTKTEILNVVTDINRKQESIKLKTSIQRFDRIEIGFDINTFQENKAARFGAEDIGMFLREAVSLSKTIMEQIGGMLND